MIDLRIHKSLELRGYLFRVLEPTADFMLNQSALAASKEASGVDLESDPEMLRMAVKTVFDHTRVQDDGDWRELTTDECANFPSGLLTALQEAFTDLQNGVSLTPDERLQDAITTISKRRDAPEAVQEYLKNLMPSEAEAPPKAPVPAPDTAPSGV